MLLRVILTFSFALLPHMVGAKSKDADWGNTEIFAEIARWGVAIFLFVLFVGLAFLVAKMVASRMRKKQRYEMHKEIVLLIERVVFFTVIILGGVIAFSLVGIDLTWVLGPLTIGLGFAFKDLFGNLIAGVVMLSQKKFRIGDVIEVHNKLGRIITMDIRTTEIQAFDGTNLIVPNLEMLTSVVRNVTANQYRRLSLRVGVHYSTPLPYAVETALKAVKSHPQIVENPPPEVLTVGFGDSAILLEVRFWFSSTLRWWELQSEVVQRIKAAFDKAGITIPFPIRTLSLDPYDRNLLTAIHVKPDYNPSYVGYTAEDLKPTNLHQETTTSPVVESFAQMQQPLRNTSDSQKK